MYKEFKEAAHFVITNHTVLFLKAFKVLGRKYYRPLCKRFSVLF